MLSLSASDNIRCYASYGRMFSRMIS